MTALDEWDDPNAYNGEQVNLGRRAAEEPDRPPPRLEEPAGLDTEEEMKSDLAVDQIEVRDPRRRRNGPRTRRDRTRNAEAEAATERAPSSWRPIDLAEALAGSGLPAPELLARSDGVKLLYLGKIHWFIGESESCKTWLAAAAAVERLNAGGRVLWVDFEDDERTMVTRLLDLGAKVEAIAERFIYLRPDEPLTDRLGRVTGGYLDLADLLAGDPFDLAVIDGVTDAMTTEQLDLKDNADVATWLRRLPKRLAAAGPAVVTIDHVTKSRDDRGRYAIGAQHKLAGTTGASYQLEVIRPFARAAGAEPSTGIVAVKIGKDRIGWIRARASGNRIATLELTGWPDGGVSAALTVPDENPAPDLTLCGRIVDYLRIYDGASQRKIEEGVDGKAANLRDALRWMAEDERRWIRVEKVGQAHRHHLTDEGRDAFTD